MEPNTGGHHVTVHGSASGGQIIAGDQNTQLSYGSAAQPPPDADLSELRRAVDSLVAQLKADVAAEAPEDKRDGALERVDELRAAVVAEKPDMTTMAYVRQWFGRNLPKLLGAVTSLILHPVVGRVVEAAGELAAEQFRDLFPAEETE
jgi:hypothetical protein